MSRLAWFSPMPPARTGVAPYSAEVVDGLRGIHQIDVYPEARAHDFIWTHLKEPYDLIVYQLGNSTLHEYIWPYLFRYPGLVVLHDGRLHHARAAALLRRERRDDYRAEFAASQNGVSPDAAELGIVGLDNYLYYNWPMRGLVVEVSRATAVHAPILAEELRAAHPRSVVEAIRLSQGEVLSEQRVREARARIRTRYRIPDDVALFGVFGGLTPEKRVPQVLRALAATLLYSANVRLMLAGAAPAHYDVVADVASQGLEKEVTLTGYLDEDDEFTDHLAACDVTVNLRWPTAREVSGPWLRALAAGRPTITMDLAHMADVPALDPRTWTVAPLGSPSDALPSPVTVAVDVLDEDHSLRLAMLRLANDEDLRNRLGAAARDYWLRQHSRKNMIEDYRRVIARALLTPRERESTRSALPPHLTDTADRKLHALLEPFGLRADPWSKL
ncbi:MAG: glycosyltransferase family 4 protein [Acidobacteria bacterium]|nr:glycosyltransferase family 4 protein [Acidobacteriota bacterium]